MFCLRLLPRWRNTKTESMDKIADVSDNWLFLSSQEYGHTFQPLLQLGYSQWQIPTKELNLTYRCLQIRQQKFPPSFLLCLLWGTCWNGHITRQWSLVSEKYMENSPFVLIGNMVWVKTEMFMCWTTEISRLICFCSITCLSWFTYR